MTSSFSYQCSICGKKYAHDEITYTCYHDGGNLNVVLDYDAIKEKYQPDDITSRTEPSLWRYLPLIPVDAPEGENTPLYAVGWTPTFELPSLAKKLGLNNLWLKDESSNPTASFKDRASAILVARAKEIGAEVIVTASTGNAGAALAGMAAAVGHKAVIFAPKTAPVAKITQLLIFGAKVMLVDGNYDDAVALAVKASNEFGWYCRNTGYNPFTIEGKKTAGFEIWEWALKTLPEHSKPLTVFISVGDGNIISGVHKGFKDLVKLGWMKQMPRIIGVQAEGSAAIANAFNAGTESITPVRATTMADSISVDMPSDGIRALRAATETGGRYVIVKDEQIYAAIAELGKVGVFAEPAGATAYAGLVEAIAQGSVATDDPVLVLNTGSGLKDVKAAMKSVGEAPIIQPTLEAVKENL
jgi:threonine synthase